MPRTDSSNGTNGRRRPAALLLVLFLAAAAVTGVQAFVPSSFLHSQQPRQQQHRMTTAMAALDSRRGSLQHTGAWGFAGAAAAVLLSSSSFSISPALAAAGGDPREALKRVIVVRTPIV
jgi:hypothetical protein